MPSIVIGAKDNGSKVADHASSIDTLIEANKDGGTNKTSFKPTSSNPGQETMQFIDGHFSEAEAVIMGLMEGPPNSKKKIVNVKPGTSVEDVVEKYKKGEMYLKESSDKGEDSSGEDAEKEAEYGTPKLDASGMGVRKNMGRNPECRPSDYKEEGQGSRTAQGRVKEASPRRAAYEIGGAVYSINVLVERYSNARTSEQKEIMAESVERYLTEAADKKLEGKDVEKYVAKRLKEEGYSKNSSKNSSGKSNSKGSGKKAA